MDKGLPPVASFILCTTPRSGSTLLCEALQASGLAGAPGEFFPEDPGQLALLQARFAAVSPADYLGRLVRSASSANGVFGAKLFAHQQPVFERAVRMAAALRTSGEASSLESGLRHTLGEVSYVWLRRRNTAAQAVSYYRALVTGEWTQRNSGTAAPAPAPDYDGVRLDRIRRLVEAMDRRWEDHFRRRAIRPLVLTYEEFGQDLGREVGLILDYCGVPRPLGLAAPSRLQRQADALSQDWEARLRRPAEAGPPAGAEAVCLLCNSPGADLDQLGAALRRSGLAGDPRFFFAKDGPPPGEAAALDAVLAKAAGENGVASLMLSAADLPTLRHACGAAFGASNSPGMPLTLLLAAWARKVRRVAMRWRDPRLQAAAMYLRRRQAAAFGAGMPQPVDHTAFEDCLAFAAKADRVWAEALAGEEMETLTVYQEDLERFPSTVLNAVLTFCTGETQDLGGGEGLRRDFSRERALLEQLDAAAAEPAEPASGQGMGEAEPSQEPSLEAASLDPPGLIAFGGLFSVDEPALAPASKARAWMEAPHARFAYRCLPMVIANQSGWLILAAETVVASWSGEPGPDAVRVTDHHGAPVRSARSTFGSGILTFLVPYLFRTPPGVNLLTRGPANLPRDGVFALEGVVETDQTEAPFTMNWMFTRPGVEVVFEKGDPIAMIAPMQRGFLESFQPERRTLPDGALRERHRRWALERVEFKAETLEASPVGEAARAAGWQKTYMQGRTVDGQSFAQHQTSLKLKPFRQGPGR